MSAQTGPVVVTPQSGAEILKRIKPQLKVDWTMICLRPDLIDEWTELQGELQKEQASQAAAGRLAQGKSRTSTALAKRVQAVEKELEENQVRFTMRGLDTPTWRALKDRNPPDPTSQVDMFLGYNATAVRDQQVRECLIDPVFEDCLDPGCAHDGTEDNDCGSWQAFELVCSPGEWSELQRLAEDVNGRVGSLPKSVLAESLLAPRSTARSSRSSGG